MYVKVLVKYIVVIIHEQLIFFFLHSFGLFEAMSAIEMMDPKMDAGMMCNQIQRKVLTFDSALEVNDSTIE